METRTPSAVIVCLAIALAVGGVAAAEEPTPVDHAINEVMIPMADGGSLATDVYLPGEGEYPTVLAITMGSKASCRRAFPRSYFFNSGDYAAVCVERRGSSGSRDHSFHEPKYILTSFTPASFKARYVFEARAPLKQ